MKNIYSFIKAYIGPTYTFFASLCSIVSIVLLFVKNEKACIIALFVVCVGLGIIVYRILKAINKVLHDNSKEEYKRISSFYVYQTNDGRMATFETFRLIQCKRLFLTQIPYHFKWTGERMPKLTSNTQTIEDVKENSDKNKWDGATIKFKHPLTYNECAVVNVKAETDDYEGVSKPWISSKLESPIEMMLFRVMLSNKPDGYNEPAIFERKQIGVEIDGGYQYIESVEFNQGNKLYSHCVVNPEPGYIYRLKWKK